MSNWANEIKDLNDLYVSFRGHLPDIVREMEQLIKTDDPNVVLLYSRRCLEVIVTDLCETELGRPRKTEPLKGIIDKLNSEEKVPGHIITSMHSLNSMATFGAHPKDFDPDQVKPVLNNLSIIIRWYLKYKDFRVVSSKEPEAEKPAADTEPARPDPVRVQSVPAKKRARPEKWVIIPIVLVAAIILLQIVTRSVSAGWNKARIYDLGRGVEYESHYFESLIDPRDGQEYRTITIGDQVWMADNLRAVVLNDGTPISHVKKSEIWETTEAPAYCWYENASGLKKSQMGALYNWFAVNTGKLCPVGWHVPSPDEWAALKFFLGDSIDWIETADTSYYVTEHAAEKMMVPGTWTDSEGAVTPANESGFSALPAGARTIYGLFYGLYTNASFWTSSEDSYNPGNGKSSEIYYDFGGLIDIQQYKQFGMSVRCIRD